jgi:hypothetical protein
MPNYLTERPNPVAIPHQISPLRSMRDASKSYSGASGGLVLSSCLSSVSRRPRRFCDRRLPRELQAECPLTDGCPPLTCR